MIPGYKKPMNAYMVQYIDKLAKELENKERADKSLRIRKRGKRTSWRSRRHWKGGQDERL